MNKDLLLTIAGANVSVTVTADASAIGAFISAVRAYASSKTVGLDVEWNSTDPSGKPALLQLCSGNRCLVVQLLFLIGGSIPQTLKDFLADPSIKFLGVGISADVAKLEKHYAIRCGNAVELGPIAAKAMGAGLAGLGLVDLAKKVLGLSIEKSANVTLSNWAGSVLGDEQIVYAVTDAYVGYLVGSKLLGGH